MGRLYLPTPAGATNPAEVWEVNCDLSEAIGPIAASVVVYDKKRQLRGRAGVGPDMRGNGSADAPSRSLAQTPSLGHHTPLTSAWQIERAGYLPSRTKNQNVTRRNGLGEARGQGAAQYPLPTCAWPLSLLPFFPSIPYTR